MTHTASTTHRIRWYVYAGSERIPRTARMRGTWAYDAVCTCGWNTKTGGATRSYIEDEIALHKQLNTHWSNVEGNAAMDLPTTANLHGNIRDSLTRHGNPNLTAIRRHNWVNVIAADDSTVTEWWLCETCGHGARGDHDSNTPPNTPCDGPGNNAAQRRMVAIGKVLNWSQPQPDKYLYGARRAIAAEIRGLMRMGRTDRWKDTLNRWAIMVEDGASGAHVRWGLTQGSIYAVHNA